MRPVALLTLVLSERVSGLQPPPLRKERSAALQRPAAPEESDAFQQSDAFQRLAVLATVPVCWGTFSPSVRYVYETPTAAMTNLLLPNGFSLAFSAAYYSIALATLATASSCLKRRETRDDSVDRAGLELGSYLFVGNCCQVFGLQSTTADAAAFLVQLTTIIVPVLEALSTGSINARTRNACIVAFLGVAVICGGDVLNARDALFGDALIVLAAVFYSLHVVRLSAFAPTFDPLDLALAKAKTETSLAVASWVGLVAVAGDALLQQREALGAAVLHDAPALLGAIIWCGAVTTAYTIYAQSYGQRDVSPARANLIYTSQPIFSALFAFLLVGEQPTLATAIGGSLILGAVLYDIIAAASPSPSSSL